MELKKIPFSRQRGKGTNRKNSKGEKAGHGLFSLHPRGGHQHGRRELDCLKGAFKKPADSKQRGSFTVGRNGKGGEMPCWRKTSLEDLYFPCLKRAEASLVNKSSLRGHQPEIMG